MPDNNYTVNCYQNRELLISQRSVNTRVFSLLQANILNTFLISNVFEINFYPLTKQDPFILTLSGLLVLSIQCFSINLYSILLCWGLFLLYVLSNYFAFCSGIVRFRFVLFLNCYMCFCVSSTLIFLIDTSLIQFFINVCITTAWQ